ncbi:MAG: protein kinase [archaeon]|nr:protein kinase [archaeon]MCQ2816616.1 protein kinase [archaeon]
MQKNIPIACLSLFYCLFVVFSAYRFIKMLFYKRKTKICIFYYVGILLCCFARVSTFFLMLFENLINKKHFYLAVSIPEMVYMSEFLVLTWHFLTHFIASHINIADDIDVFSKEDLPKIHKITNYVVYIVLPLFCSVFILLSLLSYFQKIEDNALFKVDSAFNFFTVVIFVGYYIFLILNFSGRPYKDKESTKDNKRIFLVVIIWALGRIGTGIINIIVYKKWTVTFIYEKLMEDSIFIPLMVLGFFIMTEFIPLYFALDSSIFKTFVEEEESEENKVEDEESKVENNKEESGTSSEALLRNSSSGMEERNTIQSRPSIKVDKTKITIQMKDLILNDNEEEVFSRKNGLGRILLGKYKDKDVICREIVFERLSRYDLEGVLKDMELIYVLQNENICPLLGACVEVADKIIIVLPYYQNGTLYEALHEKKIQMSFEQKKKILLGILNGLKYLNENEIYHCHLSSKNILIDDNENPIISDFGFDNLRDIASIFNKYSNKNGYTSPELLSDRSKIGHKLEGNTLHNYDVYSFGMLMWEIFEEKIPFNVKLNELIKYVVEEKCRPEITNATNKQIAELIRLCWDSDPNNRPTYDDLIIRITNIEI